MIRPVSLALVAFYWSLAAQAQAPNEIAARSTEQGLVQSALRAFERRDYPAALSLFQRASVSAPSLTVRLYLARSHAADRKSTRLNSSHSLTSRMPSSA